MIDRSHIRRGVIVDIELRNGRKYQEQEVIGVNKGRVELRAANANERSMAWSMPLEDLAEQATIRGRRRP